MFFSRRGIDQTTHRAVPEVYGKQLMDLRVGKGQGRSVGSLLDQRVASYIQFKS